MGIVSIFSLFGFSRSGNFGNLRFTFLPELVLSTLFDLKFWTIFFAPSIKFPNPCITLNVSVRFGVVFACCLNLRLWRCPIFGYGDISSLRVCLRLVPFSSTSYIWRVSLLGLCLSCFRGLVKRILSDLLLSSSTLASGIVDFLGNRFLDVWHLEILSVFLTSSVFSIA